MKIAEITRDHDCMMGQCNCRNPQILGSDAYLLLA